MLIIKKSKIYIFPSFIFLLVIILSVLKIHGSSIGIYNQIFYGPNYKDPNLLFGQVRPIRSDEYLVSTPWALAQVENGLQEQNTLYLAGQNITLSDAPTRSWAGIFEPQNWGFLILPVEQAFAFRWWIKAFMLITASYILFMMLSENNLAVSIMGAVSSAFAPFFQWWYSTSATEIASYGIFTFIFFLRLLNDRTLLARILDSLTLIYFSICFSLTLYPPFQIPLAILLIFAGTGYVLTKTPTMNTRDIRKLIADMMLVVLGIGIVLAVYYISHQSAFKALVGTTYPGIRQSKGGGMMPLKELAGFYDIQLLDNKKTIPPIMGRNQSEASSFFFLAFFLLPVYLFYLILSILKRERPDLPILFTIIILGVLLIWGTVGFPHSIARLFLLNYVDAYRMLFMLGLANHLLIVYFLCRFRIDQTLKYKIVAFLYSLVVFLTVYIIGIYLKTVGPNFIGSALKIFLISMAAGVMMLLLLYQKRILFFSLFLLFTLASTYSVNPLYRGLSPMRGSEIASVIQHIHNDDPNAIWIVYDSLLLGGDYLAANGVRVFNGTYYYPNLSFWYRFDPDHNYASIYNRYAHVVVSPTTDQTVKFKLPHGDVVELDISPCSSILQNMGIKYYIFLSPPASATCLSEVEKIDYPNLPIYIFERRSQDN